MAGMVIAESFDDGELPEGIFVTTPSGTHKSDVATYCLATGPTGSFVGFIREENDELEFIEPPIAVGTIARIGFTVTPDDDLYVVLSATNYLSPRTGYRWNGSWTTLGAMPTPTAGYSNFAIDNPSLDVHEGVVYASRVIVPDISGGSPQVSTLQVYKWTGSWVSVVEKEIESPNDYVAAPDISMDISEGTMFLRSQDFNITEEDGLAEGVVIRFWAAPVESDPVLVFDETYPYPEPFEVGILFGGSDFRVSHSPLWFYRIIQSLDGVSPERMIIFQWNGELNVVREWAGTVTDPETYLISHFVPFGVNCPTVFNGYMTPSFQKGIDESTFIQSLGYSTNLEEDWSSTPGTQIVVNVVSETLEGSPLLLTLLPSIENPTLGYAAGAELDGSVIPTGVKNYRIRWICTDSDPLRVPMRSGPVARIMNKNSALLRQILQNLRDIEPEETEGSLTLDANGYRLLDISSNADAAAIKLKEA